MEAFIFAGNYKQYNNWLCKNKYNFNDYLYINFYEKILSIDRNTPYILIGTYYENEAYHACYEKLQDYKNINRIKRS